MEATLKSKVTELFARYHFTPEDAKFISEVLGEIDERQEQKFMASKELFLTQPDKVEIIDRITDTKMDLTGKINDTRTDLTGKINDTRSELIDKINDLEMRLTGRINSMQRSIYIVGLVQFLAIVTAVLAIVGFMLK